MKVRDIQIDGFGVWSGLSVDSMPEGMTVFYGPNEAGKTTLMQFWKRRRSSCEQALTTRPKQFEWGFFALLEREAA